MDLTIVFYSTLFHGHLFFKTLLSGCFHFYSYSSRGSGTCSVWVQMTYLAKALLEGMGYKETMIINRVKKVDGKPFTPILFLGGQLIFIIQAQCIQLVGLPYSNLFH